MNENYIINELERILLSVYSDFVVSKIKSLEYKQYMINELEKHGVKYF